MKTFFKTYYKSILAFVGFALAISGVVVGMFDGGVYNANAIKYFTHQSNIIVASAFFALGILYAKESENNRIRSIFLGASVLTISITFIIQNFFIVPLTSATYFQSYQDVLTHVVTPILFVAFYFAFEQKGNIKFIDILFWIIYPIVYWAVCALTGFEPYFFLEISKIGLGMAFVWFGVFVAVFAAFGCGLVLLDKLIFKKQNKQ